jgi:dsDNA-specific endonuclease/ATPase MutS2
MVEECSCEALEWSRLLELVATFAHSRVAREWLLSMKPSQDSSWFEQEHDLVSEMRQLLAQGVAPALGGLFDPTKRYWSRKRFAICSSWWTTSPAGRQ